MHVQACVVLGILGLVALVPPQALSTADDCPHKVDAAVMADDGERPHALVGKDGDSAATCGGTSGACPPQWTHAYALGGSIGASSESAGMRFMAGAVVVADGNTEDCNGDGVPADYDGDYETGVGGGAFGYGPFAAACGHNEHGGNFVVTGLVAANVAFVVGADDQTGGIPDPVTGEATCITDGLISPGTDADDCLTGVQYSAGSVGTCTGGGDGLVWVFLFLTYVHESQFIPSASDPPILGTITAF